MLHLFELMGASPLVPLTGLGVAYVGVAFLKHSGPVWAALMIHLGLIAGLISWFAAAWG